jgi:hypothetical protein
MIAAACAPTAAARRIIAATAGRLTIVHEAHAARRAK